MPVVESAQASVVFGIACCDITPPVGIYHRMWGASAHDRSTGIHRPLSATAAIFGNSNAASLNDSADRVILITIDHCMLWPQEMNELLSRVAEAAEVPVQQIQILFTHTHGAGRLGRERADLPGGEFVGPYFLELASKLGGAVRQALKDAEHSWIAFGRGRCDLAAHRDFYDEATRQVVCGFNPAGVADDTVLVARVNSAATGSLKAVIVNYACHPTSLAWENTLISPDYPGAMRDLVEHTAGAPCVFIQGASGDLGPRDGYSGDPEVADRNGRQLGFAVLSALEAIPPAETAFAYAGAVISGATLGTWKYVPMSEKQRQTCHRWQVRHWNMRLPLREGLSTVEQTQRELDEWKEREEAARSAGDLQAASDCRAQGERMSRRLVHLADLPADGHYVIPVTLWQTGNAFWAALPAEYYHWFQLELRSRHPDAPIVVATLANGWLPGYLTPRETYGRGIYQEQVSLLAPGCLEQALDEVDAAITALRNV